jgi:DNA-binding transcriptional ArsR family regulator
VSDKEDRDSIDRDLAKALSHAVRIEILKILNEEEASLEMLARLVGKPAALVSYHTNVLRDCGCVSLTRTEPRGGSVENYYRAEPRSFIGHQDWHKVPRSLRPSVTSAALKTFMTRALAALKGGTIDDDEHFARFTLAIDAVGRVQVAEIMEAAVAQLRAVPEQSRQRVAMTGEELTSLVVGLAAFEPARRKGK